MMPMDSELRIETHGKDLKKRTTTGNLVSILPGQVLVLSWRTWHRTAKPIGSFTRRNRRLIVLLGSDRKFSHNTEVTLHGTDDLMQPLTTKPVFVDPKQKSKQRHNKNTNCCNVCSTVFSKSSHVKTI